MLIDSISLFYFIEHKFIEPAFLRDKMFHSFNSEHFTCTIDKST